MELNLEYGRYLKEVVQALESDPEFRKKLETAEIDDIKDNLECSVCNEPFDSDSHRPRSLPCGHGYCTKCVQDCITRGNTTCPVCRKRFRANVATDLPVCFLLEEFARKVVASTSRLPTLAEVGASTSRTLTAAERDALVMCPNHSGVPLHFHCNTHNKEVCHSCTVIDHPPMTCSLVSIEGKLKEMKEVEIENIEKRTRDLKDTENGIKRLCQENDSNLQEKERNIQDLEKEVQTLLNKIEQANQEIYKIKTSKEHMKDSIVQSQNKRILMRNLEIKLKVTVGKQAITQECAKTKIEIMKVKKWEDEVKKKFKLNEDKYAQVVRNDMIFSNKIIYEGSRMIIPSLSEQVKPASTATIIREEELSLTSASTRVYLELSARGCRMGRVIINVHGDRSYGKQFIMLALGTEGVSYKNKKFDYKGSTHITMAGYNMETGTISNTPVLLPLNLGEKESWARGKLSRNIAGTADFIIMTQPKDQKHNGHFGNVIQGMDIVDRVQAAEFPITDVIISDCGIILNY